MSDGLWGLGLEYGVVVSWVIAYLFVPFSLGAHAGVFVCVSAAFREEVVAVVGVVAEDYAGGCEVEDGDAGSDCEVGAVELGYDWYCC